MMQNLPKTIQWIDDHLRLIDQTKLPSTLAYVDCQRVEDVAEAIRTLRVRGAPAIGVSAAFGVYLGLRSSQASGRQEFVAEVERVIALLAGTRPTAVNLFWALERMRRVVERGREETIVQLKRALLEEALEILHEDEEVCRRIGELGAELLHDGDAVLTHCNAGGLATGGSGTALGVIYAAQRQGKRVKVYADETRPMLQGSRLTCWELLRAGVDVTLICDNMAASLMGTGNINCAIVGADRVAANGDVANKIGTYNVAVLAHVHGVPLYVAAPLSTIDLSILCGAEIPIEVRSSEEVTSIMGKSIAPLGIKVYNPAFDVTPHEYITCLITEEGIVGPPWEERLRELRRGRRSF